jgi:hypothetical protein
MRKRKYLIGVAAGLALSVAVSGVAQATITFNSQSLVATPSSGKQDKKKAGPINSLFTDVITSYTNGGGVPDRYATNTKVYFPKDFVFTTKGLPQCDPTQAGFTDGTTANAIALCGPSQVGTGGATLTSGLGDTPAVVTAFNGTPVGGQQRILLHSATNLANTTLIGTLKPSDVAGFGRMLDVPVDLGPFQGVAVITDFNVTIPRVKLPFKKSQKKQFAKKRGKCKKIRNKGKRKKCLKNVNAKEKKAKQASYITAKCSGNKTWNFQATTTYNTGAPTTAVATPTKCKQKKAKKKKKKKKKK